MKITAFLPCREGSQRVPRKNIKPFSRFENGLIEVKLGQLLACTLVDEVILSTNDSQIINYANSLCSKKLVVHRRVDRLASNETSTDDLVAHALELIPEGEVLWTHVTSPFVSAAIYEKVILKYKEALNQGFDSLMTTSVVHGFLWNKLGPINYDRKKEKWPRTQAISPLYEINSAIFLNSSLNYQQMNDRIGAKPFLYSLDKISGFDIDWEEDFMIAECLFDKSIGVWA